jgi:nucleoside-diphosphate-sugar epimerase
LRIELPAQGVGLADREVKRLLEPYAGAFNVTGDGLMTYRECAELIGQPIRKIPLRAARALNKAMWKLRQAEAPVGQIEFVLNPWIASNEKLKSTLGWTPRYTSREAFEIAMHAHGKLGRPPALRELPADARPREPSSLA